MRLSSRSKLSILLSAVSFVAIIGAIVLTAVPRGPTIHAAANSGPSGIRGKVTTGGLSSGGSGPTGFGGSVPSGGSSSGGSGPTAITGMATKVGSSSLLTSTASQPTQAASGKHYKHELLDPLGRGGPTPKESASGVTLLQSVSLSNPPAGALPQNFNGVSSLDSANANVVGSFGTFDVEPPDQGLCVGPSAEFGGQEIVIEPVNLAYNIYTTNGTPLLAHPAPLYALFQEPPFFFITPTETSGEFLSDPRCIYDPATHRFFFTVTAVDPDNLHSHIDITVFDPNTPEITTYRLNTTDAANVAGGCPCFGDQPKLGIDQFNIYVSTDEFTLANLSFNGSNVYAISKSQLAAFETSVNFAAFLHLDDEGPVPALQPAVSAGNAPVEYLVHSFVTDVNGFLVNASDRLGVFAIANGQVVSSGGLPTLLGPVVADSEGYSQPEAAPSTGGVTLDAGDDRLQQVQYINGRLWAALDTGLSISGSLFCNQEICDAAAWFQIAPVLIYKQLIGAEVTQQGYVGLKNTSVLYPAIVQSPDGTVDMAFSVTSKTLNPSAAFAVDVNQDGNAFIAATGTGPDTGFTCSPCRWGDYSWATLDPNSNNIWMGSEYIPPVSSQSSTFGGSSNWGTRIYEVAA